MKTSDALFALNRVTSFHVMIPSPTVIVVDDESICFGFFFLENFLLSIIG